MPPGEVSRSESSSDSMADAIADASPSDIEVLVKYAGRFEPFIFNLSPAAPLKDLKLCVRRVFGGVTPILLVLYGVDLLGEDDDATLQQCGIDGETILDLGYHQPFTVSFWCLDFKYMVDVDCFHTVLELKEMIEERTGIPVHHQRLMSDKFVLSELDCTLLSYSIFTIEPIYAENWVLSLEFPDDFLRYFRSKAEETYSYGIDLPVHRLSLREDDASAADMEIRVKTGYLSEPLSLNLSSMLPLRTLKRALQSKYGSRKDEVMLLLNGKDLFQEEKTSSLEHCGIKSGDTLILGYKGSFHVSFFDVGGGYRVDIDCTDTVGKLKEKIEYKTSIPADDQILSCKGVELSEPERTLFSYGMFRTRIGAEIYKVTIDRPGRFCEDNWFM